MELYGNIKFPSTFTSIKGSHTNTAKWIKISHETDAKSCFNNLLQKWDLKNKKPEVVLSITGGAKQFSINDFTKSAFKEALIKTAKITNAWIISGGTDCGVMKLVGDAVLENLHLGIVIGIATWSCIAGKDILEKCARNEVYYDPENVAVTRTSKQGVEPVPLNPNHSHFIFVDDGKEKFGSEISFRSAFENALIQNERDKNQIEIPMILIVLEGGIGTLRTVIGALRKNIPVILVTGTKGCVDLLVTVRELRSFFDELKNDQAEYDLLKNHLYEKISIKKLENEIECIEYLREIITTKKYENLINEFELKSGSSNFQSIIMKALLRAKKNEDSFKIGKLAIQLNQLEIAENELSKNPLSKENLNRLLKAALIYNKADFVNLILLYKAYKLDEELTNQIFMRIEKFPSKPYVRNLLEANEFYTREFKKVFVDIEPFFLDSYFSAFDKANSKAAVTSTRTSIEMEPFLKSESRFTIDTNMSVLLRCRLELKLFFWALFTERYEIAKIFWRLARFQISNALIASKILKKKAEKDYDKREMLEFYSKSFEDLAIGVVKTYEKETKGRVNDALIIYYFDHLKMDYIDLAVKCDCKQFLAMNVVQRVLDNVWKGEIFDESHDGQDDDDAGYTHEIGDNFEEDIDDNNNFDVENNNYVNTGFEEALRESQRINNDGKGYRLHYYAKNKTKHRFIQLLEVPYHRFLFNNVFYCIFLLLFSWFMLFSFKPSSINSYQLSLNYSNVNETVLVEETLRTNRVLDIVLLIWVLAIFVEEITQFINGMQMKSFMGFFANKYWHDKWNWFDLPGCLLFFIGLFLKQISVDKTDKTFVWARIILSINLGIWFLRLLHIFSLFENLGPKIAMIKAMLGDLRYFLAILMNFILAFGIAIQAILYPHNEFSFDVFYNILNTVYWPIFGEIIVLESLDNPLISISKSVNDDQILIEYKIVSYFLLMIYMIISSVLLLNLLIAIFSSTYGKIQTNSEMISRNQRYQLICEYINNQIVTPPFNLIYYPLRAIIKCKNCCKENRDSNSSAEFLSFYEKYCAEQYLKKESEVNKIA